jgi:hypothetical protein
LKLWLPPLSCILEGVRLYVGITELIERVCVVLPQGGGYDSSCDEEREVLKIAPRILELSKHQLRIRL